MDTISEKPIHGSPEGSHLALPEQHVDQVDDDAMRRRPKRAVTVEGTGHEHGREHAGQRRTRSGGDAPAPSAATILRRVTTSLFTPEVPVGKAPGYLASFKAAFFSSWM